MARHGVTHDTLLGGSIRLVQPVRGYRVNVDSLLLASFAAVGQKARLAVDLGAGVGVLSLLLGQSGAAARFALVEREAELLELARQNIAHAKLEATLHAIDIERQRLPRELVGQADLVVANPPFYAPDEHRSARHPLARAAKHGSVTPFVTAAAQALVGSRGRAAFVYPARSLPALLEASQRAGLVPKRLRFVHPHHEAAARLALCELRRARRGGLVVEPPLVEWSAPGRRSAELERIVG
jgi:tRNA1(Val) A37 N6-methylase TrmN6